MAMVNTYIPHPTPLMFETDEGKRMASACLEFGGWNHREKTLTPIRVTELLAAAAPSSAVASADAPGAPPGR